MAEPDELYTLRAQYWLGHYTLCLEEGKAISRRPMPPHLKNEREEFLLRAQLALGQYDKVVKETQGMDVPAMKALNLHARYLSADKDTSREEIVATLKTQLAEDNNANSTSFQLYACHIFLRHSLTREALQCVNLGLTMEHLAMSLQIFIKIDRLDLAESQLRLMKQGDEDSVLTQLCSAYISIATGRSVIPDAIHVLGMLSEQYGPSVMLLNLTAVSQMTACNYEGAEALLVEASTAILPGEDYSDTLINSVVCALHMKKGNEKIEPLLTKLKAQYPNHPYVVGLLRVESAFDREANKYLVRS